MSLISVELKKDANGKILSLPSPYAPDEKTKDRLSLIRNSFAIGYLNQTTPRREFNDLSLIQRISNDRMSWNTYQPNDGSGIDGDEINSWRSNAIKPIVRNKAISVAAHITSKLIFPGVFAQNPSDDEDQDAAMVMKSLIEWVGDQAKYPKTFLYSVIGALVDPASIVHEEYAEVYRTIREMGEDGKYTEKQVIDEEFSGVIQTPIECDELLIENFYQENIQKQGFLILRKVISYSTAMSKYGADDNFKFVQPGIITIYNDANQTFYNEYDTNLSGELVEEVVYWNRTKDLKLTCVNGILIGDADTPNPRADKKYPFAKTFYEPFDQGRCFYGKSLVFKMGPDSRIINELYPMIIDGTYLTLFPPMVATGAEDIGGDTIIPGMVTTFQSPDANLKPINSSSNLSAGITAMMDVTKSLSDSSIDPILQGSTQQGARTAFEVRRMEDNALIDFKIFLQMIGFLVQDLGTLMMGDIIQFMTIAQVEEIAGEEDKLKYSTYLLPESQTEDGMKSKKIQFTAELPDEMTEDEKLDAEFDVLEEEGMDSKRTIIKVNPEMFRKNKYKIVISPDARSPYSDEVEKAFKLEAYDRMISNPLLDQESVTKDFLLGVYDLSARDPQKYIKQQAPAPMPGMDPNAPGGGYVPGQQGGTPSAQDILSQVNRKIVA
jgi:hypothetical protein